MNKIIQLVCAVAIGIGSIAIVPTVGAEPSQPAKTCNNIVIKNTGPESHNNGTCTVKVEAKVVCTNNVYVLDSNSQSAATGQAAIYGTTNSNTAISGDATNSNGQSVEIGATCAAANPDAPVVPTAPVAPTTPPSSPSASDTSTTPAGGAGAAAPAPQPAPRSITSLPDTATNSTTTIIASTIFAAVMLFAATRITAVAYQRINQG